MSSSAVLSVGWNAAVQGPPTRAGSRRHCQVAGPRATGWPVASKMAFVWAPAETKSTAP